MNFSLKVLSLALLPLFISCASRQAISDETSLQAKSQTSLSPSKRETAAESSDLLPRKSDIPSPHAFRGFNDKSKEEGNVDPRTLTRVQLKCEDSKLYPTHPQSSLKLYHISMVGSYDHGKMKWDDEACRMPQPPVVPNDRRRCLAPDLLTYQVISDTYIDGCGNYYRAFWKVLFLHKNESMGTMISKGRTLYERSNSQFAGDFEEGETYAVAASDFIFLTALQPNDAPLIRSNVGIALKTRYRFNSKTRLFELIKKQ